MKENTRNGKNPSAMDQGISQNAARHLAGIVSNRIDINNYISKVGLIVLAIFVSCFALANGYTGVNTQTKNISFLAEGSGNKPLDNYKEFKEYLETLWPQCLGQGYDKAYISSVINTDVTDIVLETCIGVVYTFDEDYEKAVNWYSKAAEQNFSFAQNILGQMNYFGLGVNQNPEKAIEWYTKSAEQNNLEAQYNLGNMYLFGTGVEQDTAKALEWLYKAGNQKHPKARYQIGNVLSKILKKYELAATWYEGAGDYAPAQYSLAQMYINGQGVTKDINKAINLYTAAAEQGHMEAQTNLGLLYFNGQVVDKDYKEAFTWLSKGADQNDFLAQKTLAIMYMQGWGVEQSDEQADYWLKRSEENQ